MNQNRFILGIGNFQHSQIRPHGLALLWQINDFCDSLGGVSVIHWEPAFEGAGDGSGLD
jgi:hypothetical protein